MHILDFQVCILLLFPLRWVAAQGQREAAALHQLLGLTPITVESMQVARGGRKLLVDQWGSCRINGLLWRPLAVAMERGCVPAYRSAGAHGAATAAKVRCRLQAVSSGALHSLYSCVKSSVKSSPRNSLDKRLDMARAFGLARKASEAGWHTGDIVASDKESLRAWGALHPHVLRAVLNLGFTQPTEIQELALSKTVAPTWRDSLLLAETGSGKTLAYLLPTLHRVKEIEDATAVRARPRRPRALVIVPTRELGEQVLKEAKSLAHVAKFSAAGMFGGGSRSEQATALAHGCDLLVGTPLRLVSLAQDGLLHFGDVRAVAVDEADTIFAQGFRAELEQILAPVRAAASHASTLHQQWLEQVVCVCVCVW
jgi:hypothetical protein